MRKRFKKSEDIEWHSNELEKVRKLQKPSTIFIGSIYDVWGSWVYREFQNWIVQTMDDLNGKYIFLLLSKNQYAYDDFPFIKNLWLGLSDDGSLKKDDYHAILAQIPNSTFISFEPLIAPMNNFIHWPSISWIIIGTLNQNGRPIKPEKGGTKKEWILKLIEQADKYNIPVFIKKECYMLYPDLPMRKEIAYFKG